MRNKNTQDGKLLALSFPTFCLQSYSHVLNPGHVTGRRGGPKMGNQKIDQTETYQESSSSGNPEAGNFYRFLS